MENLLFAGAFMAFEDIPSLDWPTLEKIACVRFTKAHRTQLLKVTNAYIYGLAYHRQAPHVKDVRLRINQIKTHAFKLNELLADASPTGLAALDEVYPWKIAEPPVLQALLQELIFNIRKLEQEKRLSGKAGKPRDVALPRLIRAWYTVYREAGGTIKGCYWSPTQKQYRGRFLALLEEMFYDVNTQLSSPSVKALAWIQFTHDGLAQAITSALSVPQAKGSN